MRLPNESLDDFSNLDSTPKPAEPPAVKALQVTGKVEVLKPIARPDQLVRFRAATGRIALRPEPLPVSKGFSWYHRSLAFSGAVAAAALLLGIFAGIYAPTEQPGQIELVTSGQPNGIDSYQKEEGTNDLSDTVRPQPLLLDKFYSSRKVEKRRSLRRQMSRTVSRSLRAIRPPQIVVSTFVPTTLVIYVENGEVRTRVEPQVGTVHKKKT